MAHNRFLDNLYFHFAYLFPQFIWKWSIFNFQFIHFDYFPYNTISKNSSPLLSFCSYQLCEHLCWLYTYACFILTRTFHNFMKYNWKFACFSLSRHDYVKWLVILILSCDLDIFTCLDMLLWIIYFTFSNGDYNFERGIAIKFMYPWVLQAISSLLFFFRTNFFYPWFLSNKKKDLSHAIILYFAFPWCIAWGKILYLIFVRIFQL